MSVSGGEADAVASGTPGGPTSARWTPLDDRLLPAWLGPTTHESRVPVATATLVAAALQMVLTQHSTVIHPTWLLPSLELALLAMPLILSPLRTTRYATQGRYVSLALVAIISLDNGFSAVLLDTGLISGTVGSEAAPLLASTGAIYLTNIIAFAIWCWELDRGGPLARAVNTLK